MAQAGHIPPGFLPLPPRGDLDELPNEDVQEDERFLRERSWLFSAHQTRCGENLWVIAEWDRSATTMHLPSDS
jgi:hypothetical protein